MYLLLTLLLETLLIFCECILRISCECHSIIKTALQLVFTVEVCKQGYFVIVTNTVVLFTITYVTRKKTRNEGKT